MNDYGTDAAADRTHTSLDIVVGDTRLQLLLWVCSSFVPVISD